MSYYLLKWTGKKRWFMQDGPIGPRFTNERNKALKFGTAENAMRDPCYSHPTSMVEVVKVGKDKP
jgi:hypothetical protein